MLPDVKKLVAIFLSEIIRSRRTSIKRAAEIASRVVSSVNKLNSEKEVLDFLTDIEKDFSEVTSLRQVLHFGRTEIDLKVYEGEIKEYAAEVLRADMVSSAKFLKDASDPKNDIRQLCLRYPDFCNFLSKNPEKSYIFNQVLAY